MITEVAIHNHRQRDMHLYDDENLKRIIPHEHADFDAINKYLEKDIRRYDAEWYLACKTPMNSYTVYKRRKDTLL